MSGSVVSGLEVFLQDPPAWAARAFLGLLCHPPSVDQAYRPAPELAPVHQEINVIGQRAEEARDAVDEFLDRAVMATASRVRIVHGYGMGVLRKVIQELLGRHPHVARFYPAPQQEGGAGATIVELKD